MSNFKQVVLMRTDLNMGRGKIAAQAGHAVVIAYKKALSLSKADVDAWEAMGMQKVVLKVSGKENLFKYFQQAKDAGLPTAMVKDAGRTQIPSGTHTCCAIGPAEEDKIDAITGDLKLL
ncbi:MAG: peptidyl-tRNA hydrolase Pth2 [Candidatus Diapherotrites archaeon]|nr:peptidyl-tRNA hydrolase Pth2 [Candidatus Diapherotrites archaeon]